MTDPIRIRSATLADAAALAELLNEIIAIGGTTAIETPFTPESFADAFLRDEALVSCVIAEDASGALGFQHLAVRPRLPEGWGEIATFARRSNPRPGTGRALFAETRARAKAAGLIAIDATIRADNTGGLAFYSKMGFVDDHVTEAVPLADGIPVDRISKRFDLT
ncbi:MAG: GNAT family N-acetyltransferase [Pseudomonadota bacterium]